MGQNHAMMLRYGDGKMTKILKIALTETEMQLLLKSSALDCRRPQEQARYILRSALLGNSVSEKSKGTASQTWQGESSTFATT